MNPTHTYARIFFVFLCLLFALTFTCQVASEITLTSALSGLVIGLLLALLLLGAERVFRHMPLKAFNILALGLFFGYLMAISVVTLFQAAVDLISISVQPPFIDFVKLSLFLLGTYLGVMMTLKASDELAISIPFIRLSASDSKSKELILDLFALADPRIIDLAASGLLDRRLVFPRFLMQNIHDLEECAEENAKAKGRRALETLKRLETLPTLSLRIIDTDFPDIKDSSIKTLRLARLLDADLLSGDQARALASTIDGVRVINIHSIAGALKPLMQKGELLKIKIQRAGKEEGQGVGYLEDGTMVVVNGGGEFMGEIVQTRVLSAKHTTSGRMIFCNVSDDEYELVDVEEEEECLQ